MSIATLRVLSVARPSTTFLIRSPLMRSRGSVFVREIRLHHNPYSSPKNNYTWNLWIKPTLFTFGCIGGYSFLVSLSSRTLHNLYS